MRRYRHKARWWTLLLVVPLLVDGCDRRETRVEYGDREQILYKGNGSEPQELDPDIVTGVPEYHIIMSLLEGLVSEDPHDLHHRVPIPCGRRCAVEFVDLSEVTDRLHVTTVCAKHELSLGRNEAHQPLSIGRKCHWKRDQDFARPRQNAYEANCISG